MGSPGQLEEPGGQERRFQRFREELRWNEGRERGKWGREYQFKKSREEGDLPSPRRRDASSRNLTNSSGSAASAVSSGSETLAWGVQRKRKGEDRQEQPVLEKVDEREKFRKGKGKAKGVEVKPSEPRPGSPCSDVSEAAASAVEDIETLSPFDSDWSWIQPDHKTWPELGMLLKNKVRAQPGLLGRIAVSHGLSEGVAGREDAGGSGSSSGAPFRSVSRELLPFPLPAEFGPAHKRLDDLVNLEEEREQQGLSRTAEETSEFYAEFDKLELEAGVEAWVFVMVASLNILYSGHGKHVLRRNSSMGPSDALCRALELLEQDARFICSLPGSVPPEDWSSVLADSRISYTGEEVSVARPLRWDLIKAGLPTSPELCGKIMAVDVANDGLKHFLSNPENLLKPKEQWPEHPPTARVNVLPGGWKDIACGLVEYSIACVVPESEVVGWNGGLLLNGACGVGQKEFLPGLWESDESEVLRFIMNLIPFNSICTEDLKGEVDSLPYMSQWSGITMAADQSLLWSSEDLKAMFYLFRLGYDWAKYQCFSEPVEESWFSSQHLPLHYKGN